MNVHVLTKEAWQTTDQLGDGTAANALAVDKHNSNVNWSPEIGFEELGADGKATGVRHSPTTILAHEIKHSWDQLKKRFAHIIDKIAKREAQETSATELQNRVGLNKPNPEGDRTDYSKGNKTIQTDVNSYDGKKTIKRNEKVDSKSGASK